MKKSEGAQTIQAAIGQQEGIYLFQVPDGVTFDKTQTLLGQVLTVNGDYYAHVSCAGLANIEAHLKATLSVKTCTTDFYLTFMDNTTKKGNSAAGVGAMVSGTLQDLTLTALRGEKYAILKLTIAGAAGSVTFTQAESNGL